MKVCVVYSEQPRQLYQREVALPLGSTVLQALEASGVLQAFPHLQTSVLDVGVWGCKVDATQALREHDRVEIYRPLKTDPKTARRERFKQQGARKTGLFAHYST